MKSRTSRRSGSSLSTVTRPLSCGAHAAVLGLALGRGDACAPGGGGSRDTRESQCPTRLKPRSTACATCAASTMSWTSAGDGPKASVQPPLWRHLGRPGAGLMEGLSQRHVGTRCRGSVNRQAAQAAILVTCAHPVQAISMHRLRWLANKQFEDSECYHTSVDQFH